MDMETEEICQARKSPEKCLDRNKDPKYQSSIAKCRNEINWGTEEEEEHAATCISLTPHHTSLAA